MSYVGASILVIGFLVTFQLLGAVSRARSIFALTRVAVDTLSNAALDDEGKEKAMQSIAVRLLSLFGLMVLLTAASVAVPVLIILALDKMNVVSFNETIETSTELSFIVIATVIVTCSVGAYNVVARRTRDRRASNSKSAP